MQYMKAEITIQPGHLPAMLELLQTRIFPIMESGTWRLVGCFVQRTGRLNTIVDLWEMDSLADFDTTYAIFRGHPDYPEIRVLLDTYVETETLVFMDARAGRILQQKG
ncbi:NIPSNAP family protein [Polymorphobacter sp.]|uniref:NIPSNAP family protein n=1 Tax=Polymorphobacter sp. TaxID=1909290 RepID=UPI003F72768C